jgi:peroxidase
MREHNRISDKVLATHPYLKDQEVYTIARNYVIGLIQHIAYDEYLPILLGKRNFDKYIGRF